MPMNPKPLTSLRSPLTGDVILGGGVCGCLLARQLLHLTARPVCLIEAGGAQNENTSDRLQPARWLHLLGSSDDDAHVTMPNDALAGRRMRWPRGRGLGGSGRINAMIWLPPHESDFQMLAPAGLNPEAMQTAWKTAQQRIAIESPRYLSDVAQRFLDTVNGHSDLGVFAAHQRINVNSRRWTTDQLLTDLAQSDPDAFSRLSCVHATVETLHVTDGRVDRVTLRDASDQQTLTLASDARVIGCLGALATPALLMRSGIGDAETLDRAGVHVRVHSPNVGRNLHDHLIMPVVYSRQEPAFLPGDPTADHLSKWEQSASGPLASNIAECGGFDPEAKFQMHVTPTDYLRYPSPKAGSAMTLGVQLTRPGSRGWLEIDGRENNSPKTRLHPIIHSNYLSDPSDVLELLIGIEWARRIGGILFEAGCHQGERIPGPRRTEASALLASIARYAQTLYHPGGTCAIGTNPHNAVTDPEFNVFGVDGLSIVDASLLPQPAVGNPTATLAMLTCYAAERLAQSSARQAEWSGTVKNSGWPL